MQSMYDPLFPTRTRPLPVVPDAQAAIAALPVLLARLPGVDPPSGRALLEAEQAALMDVFARHILTQARPPMTLDDLAAAVTALNGSPNALPNRHVFAVAESGQILWSPDSAALPRKVRYAVTFGRAPSAGADLLVSTRPPSGDREAFLQVAAWDFGSGALQFYARVGGTWFWEGSSWHALLPLSRGNGAFDSHVNGAPVMKELIEPWLHWNSTSQIIPLESFPPDHPVRTDQFFPQIESAHLLEKEIVRPLITRWTRSRLDRESGDPAGVAAPETLIRHLLSATTVNIRSSLTRSVGLENDIVVPLTFFFDKTLLVDRLDLDARTEPPVTIQRDHYQSALLTHDIHLQDSRSGFRQAGDAFFAWPFPERAEEDQAIVTELLRRGLLSPEFAIALLMVDFPNPVDSAARASLLTYVPQGPLPATEIEPRMRAALAGAGTGTGSPAGIASAYLALNPDQLRATAVAEINAFLDAVRQRAATQAGVTELMRLADYRRRAFRTRKLAEFDLSLPFGRDAGDGAPIELRRDASVGRRPSAAGSS